MVLVLVHFHWPIVCVVCDSLKPTNLLLLLSAVCQWQEVGAAGDAAKEPKHSAAGEKRQEAAPQSAGPKAEAAEETGGGGGAGGLSRAPTLGAGGSAPHSAVEPAAGQHEAADEAEEQTARAASTGAVPPREPENAPPAWQTLTPGALLVEPTSLKALSNGPALLYLKTTGIRAMSFSLPPGYSRETLLRRITFDD